ncbi:MAG: helix-turn-helix transcriptional regulator [Erysipelotrichales bacterium]|nr:helix-turn-helix transcriptional regulator [Erysipelotrichales bacterium]
MALENLKALRKKLGLTQEQMADQLGFKRYTISDWESGRTEPDIESINKIAKKYNVTTDFLLGMTDLDNPSSITEDDFLIAFSGLSGDLTEEQKKQMLDIANSLVVANKVKK